MVIETALAHCLAAFSLIAEERAPKQTQHYRDALSHNVCAAAESAQIEPSVLIALILTENGKLITNQLGPASSGVDVGLCQINTAAHPEFSKTGLATHPYFCSVYAAEIIKKYLRRYGEDWRAIASYWNPKLASQGADQAFTYYTRWRGFHHYTLKKFWPKLS